MSGSPPAAAERQPPPDPFEEAPAAPLGAEEFDRRLAALGPFETPPRLAVAVSGGADSTALAVLARDWARQRGGTVRAFLVDHGLRPESAREAARTLGRLAGLGIPARLLLWRAPVPLRRVQERARAARLALLEAACAEAGILHLLLGHHAGDQRETVAMRAARRSGPDGLAGMPALRETARVRLLRPLLDVPKERLVATLRAHGIAWEEDPSNRDPRFERARLRRSAAPSLPALAAIAAAGRDRAAREEALAALAARIVRPDPRHHRLAIEAAPLLAAPPELARTLLRRALHTVGGGPYPPAPAAVARLLVNLAGAPGRTRRSLGRCLVSRDGPLVTIAPEPARACRARGADAPPLAGAAFLPMLLE